MRENGRSSLLLSAWRPWLLGWLLLHVCRVDCEAQGFHISFVDNDRIVLNHTLGNDARLKIVRVSGSEGERDFAGLPSPITDLEVTQGETYEYQLFVFDPILEEFVGSGGPQSATVGEVRGLLPHDLTWAADRVLFDDVVVPETATLTIRGAAPDQRVSIQNAPNTRLVQLNFMGKLEAENVTFRSLDRVNSAVSLLGRSGVPFTPEAIKSTLVFRNVNLEDVDLDAANNPTLENVNDGGSTASRMRLFNLENFLFKNSGELSHTTVEFHLLSGSLEIKDSRFSNVVVMPAEFNSQTEDPKIDGRVIFSGNTLTSTRNPVSDFLNFGTTGIIEILNNRKDPNGVPYELELEFFASPPGLTDLFREISGNTGVSNLFLNQVSNTEVRMNTINTPQNQGTAGITVNGNHNRVVNNTVAKDFDLFASEFSAGIHVNGNPATGNRIEGNTVTEYGTGILLARAVDNVIRDNDLDGNNNGIFLNGTGVNIPEGNQIFNNRIVNTLFSSVRLGEDCFTGCPNSWNAERMAGSNILGGPFIGGNFYGDFFGAVDTDSPPDGLSNVSRMHNAVNVDNLPLMPPQADLQVNVLNPPTQVAPGGLLSFSFEVVNLGPSVLGDPISLDIFGLNLATDQFATPVDPSAGADFCSLNLSAINCNLASGLGVGEMRTGTVSFRISPDVLTNLGPDGLQFGFFLSTQAPVSDPDNSDNSRTVRVDVLEDIDGDGLSTSIEEMAAAALGDSDVNSNGIADHEDPSAALFLDRDGNAIAMHFGSNPGRFNNVVPKSTSTFLPPIQFDPIADGALGFADVQIDLGPGAPMAGTTLEYRFSETLMPNVADAVVVESLPAGTPVVIPVRRSLPGLVELEVQDGGPGDNSGPGDGIIDLSNLAVYRERKANLVLSGPAVVANSVPGPDGTPHIGSFDHKNAFELELVLENTGELPAENVEVTVAIEDTVNGLVKPLVPSQVDGAVSGSGVDGLTWTVPKVTKGTPAKIKIPIAASFPCACQGIKISANATTTTMETRIDDNAYQGRLSQGSVPLHDQLQVALAESHQSLEDAISESIFRTKRSLSLAMYQVDRIPMDPEPLPMLRDVMSSISIDPDNNDLAIVKVTAVPEANQFGERDLDLLLRSPLPNGSFHMQVVKIPLKIVPLNDSPEFDAPATAGTDEDKKTTVPFSISDVDTSEFEVKITVNSKDPDKVKSGGLSITGDGPQRTLSVTPEPNAHGPVELELEADDGAGGLTLHDILLTIRPVNDPPTIVGPAEATSREDQPNVLEFTVDDIEDVEPPEVQVSVSSGEGIVINQEGITKQVEGNNVSLGYTPNPNASGEATLLLQAIDRNITVTKRELKITIQEVNDPPMAVDDNVVVPAGSRDNLLDVLENDSIEPDKDETLSIRDIVVPPSNGQAKLTPEGQLVYTPNQDFAGQDDLKYTLEDSRGLTATGNVRVLVSSSVEVPDDALEARLRFVLNIPPGVKFDVADFLRLELDLDLSNGDIESLEGLQHATNLKGLNVSGNNVRDLTPLEFLRQLETLDVSDNLANINEGTENDRILNTIESRGASVVRTKQRQDIIFEPIPEIPVCIGQTMLNVTGGASGNPVELSSAAGVAFLPGDFVVFPNGEADYQITATQEGNDKYFAAQPVLRFAFLRKERQVVRFDPLPQGRVFGDNKGSILLAAQGATDQITFESSNPSVASVVAGRLFINGAGTATITARDPGDDCIRPGEASQGIRVARAPQELSLEPFLDQIFAFGRQISIRGQGQDSGIPIQFLVNPTDALTLEQTEFVGREFNILATLNGVFPDVQVTVSQAPNNNFLEAPSVTRNFSIRKGVQQFSFPAIGTKHVGDLPFDAFVTSDDRNEPVILTSLTPEIVSVEGHRVTILKGGTARIQATQAGNALFNPAEPIVQEFLVNCLPVVSGLTTLTGEEDGTIGPISVTIEDKETPFDQLTLETVIFGTELDGTEARLERGSGAGEMLLTIVPPKDLSGSGSVTITATDEHGGVGLGAAPLTIASVNDPPTIVHDPNFATESVFRFSDKETPNSKLELEFVLSGPDNVDPFGFDVLDVGFLGPELALVDIIPMESILGDRTLTGTVRDEEGAEASVSVDVRIEGTRVVDGYVAGSSVFADLNGNGILDPEEPTGTTDALGGVILVLPPDFSGAILASGGTDIATGVPLTGILKAPAGSGVVSAISTVVTELVNRGRSLTEAQAVVKTAFKLPDSLDLLNTDPIAGTQVGDSGAGALLGAVVQVQNLIVQANSITTGAMGSGASGGVSDQVISAVAGQVEQNRSVNLTDPNVVESILQETVTNTGVPVSDQIVGGAAGVIAAANEVVSEAVETMTGPGFDTLVEVAQVQKVAFTGTAEGLMEASAGREAIETVVSSFTGSNLQSQVVGVTVNSPLGNERPTISGISDQRIDEDGILSGIEVVVGDSDSAVETLAVRVVTSNTHLIPEQNVIVTGAGTTRQIELRPLPDSFGSSDISVSVSDGRLSATTEFRLEVLPVNDKPSIGAIEDVQLRDGESREIRIQLTDPDGDLDQLLLSVASENRELITVDDSDVVGSGSERRLVLQPKPGVGGSGRIVIGVTDGEAVATTGFNVTVDVASRAVSLTIVRVGEDLLIEWQSRGALQVATDIGGPYVTVPGAVSPFRIHAPTAGMQFFRVIE